MPTALVWGASGGIGSALVDLLKARDWTVYAAARHEERIPDVADETYSFDAGDVQSIEAVCRFVAQETESLDLVVYTAGANVQGALQKLTTAEWQAVMDANLNGVQYSAAASLDLLAKGGHFIAVGAKVEVLTLPRMGAYAAAKAALQPLIAILQKENRKYNFSLIRPPAVNTAFWENVPFKMPDYALPPQQVAEAILARYESGENGQLDIESPPH